MSSQKRTIMGSLDYSIESLNNMKKQLREIGNPNHELNWAIGGIISALVSNLLMTSFEVVADSLQGYNDDAKGDLKKIQTEFNKFIEGMINND